MSGSDGGANDLVTSHSRDEKSTVTVRLVKNFEYRTIRNLILRDVDLNMATKDLMAHVLESSSLSLLTSFPCGWRNPPF